MLNNWQIAGLVFCA